jgi:multiple sugar transport system permease protein
MKLKSGLAGYAYVLPLLLGVAGFTLYPALEVIWMSFQHIELADMVHPRFAGWTNFTDIFSSRDPTFESVLRITFAFVFGSVFFHVVLGLGLALLLNIPWLKGRTFLRNAYMLPWIAAGIIVGYTWSLLFEPRTGLLNYALHLAGLPPQAWTSNINLALPAIIVANVWRGVPYSLILQTSGLQSINPELYEAAWVDGANAWQRLTGITLPLIKEFILLNLVLDTGMTFHVFDTIFAMTAGGPMHRTETFSIYKYNQGFTFGRLGRGAAVGVLLLAVSLVVALVYIRFFRSGRRRE